MAQMLEDRQVVEQGAEDSTNKEQIKQIVTEHSALLVYAAAHGSVPPDGPFTLTADERKNLETGKTNEKDLDWEGLQSISNESRTAFWAKWKKEHNDTLKNKTEDEIETRADLAWQESNEKWIKQATADTVEKSVADHRKKALAAVGITRLTDETGLFLDISNFQDNYGGDGGTKLFIENIAQSCINPANSDFNLVDFNNRIASIEDFFVNFGQEYRGHQVQETIRETLHAYSVLKTPSLSNNKKLMLAEVDARLGGLDTKSKRDEVDLLESRKRKLASVGEKVKVPADIQKEIALGNNIDTWTLIGSNVNERNISSITPAILEHLNPNYSGVSLPESNVAPIDLGIQIKSNGEIDIKTLRQGITKPSDSDYTVIEIVDPASKQIIETHRLSPKEVNPRNFQVGYNGREVYLYLGKDKTSVPPPSCIRLYKHASEGLKLVINADPFLESKKAKEATQKTLESGKPYPIHEAMALVEGIPDRRGNPYWIEGDIPADAISKLSQEQLQSLSIAEPLWNPSRSKEAWLLNKDVFEPAYILGGDHPNARYMHGGEAIGNNFGVFAVAAASASTPEKQAAYYQSFMKAVLAVHRTGQDVVGNFLRAQIPSEEQIKQYEEGSISEFKDRDNKIAENAYRDKHHIPYAEKLTDAQEREMLKLLTSDLSEDPNLFLVLDIEPDAVGWTLNLDKTISGWEKRLPRLEAALNAGTLTPEQMQQLEFLSHAVNAKKLIELMQQPSPEPPNPLPIETKEQKMEKIVEANRRKIDTLISGTSERHRELQKKLTTVEFDEMLRGIIQLDPARVGEGYDPDRPVILIGQKGKRMELRRPLTEVFGENDLILLKKGQGGLMWSARHEIHQIVQIAPDGSEQPLYDRDRYIIEHHILDQELGLEERPENNVNAQLESSQQAKVEDLLSLLLIFDNKLTEPVSVDALIDQIHHNQLGILSDLYIDIQHIFGNDLTIDPETGEKRESTYPLPLLEMGFAAADTREEILPKLSRLLETWHYLALFKNNEIDIIKDYRNACQREGITTIHLDFSDADSPDHVIDIINPYPYDQGKQVANINMYQAPERIFAAMEDKINAEKAPEVRQFPPDHDTLQNLLLTIKSLAECRKRNEINHDQLINLVKICEAANLTPPQAEEIHRIAQADELPIEMIDKMLGNIDVLPNILNEQLQLARFEHNPYIGQLRDALGYKQGEFPKVVTKEKKDKEDGVLLYAELPSFFNVFSSLAKHGEGKASVKDSVYQKDLNAIKGVCERYLSPKQLDHIVALAKVVDVKFARIIADEIWNFNQSMNPSELPIYINRAREKIIALPDEAKRPIYLAQLDQLLTDIGYPPEKKQKEEQAPEVTKFPADYDQLYDLLHAMEGIAKESQGVDYNEEDPKAAFEKICNETKLTMQQINKLLSIATASDLPIAMISPIADRPLHIHEILNEELKVPGFEDNAYIGQIREALGYKKGEFPQVVTKEKQDTEDGALFPIEVPGFFNLFSSLAKHGEGKESVTDFIYEKNRIALVERFERYLSPKQIDRIVALAKVIDVQFAQIIADEIWKFKISSDPKELYKHIDKARKKINTMPVPDEAKRPIYQSQLDQLLTDIGYPPEKKQKEEQAPEVTKFPADFNKVRDLLVAMQNVAQSWKDGELNAQTRADLAKICIDANLTQAQISKIIAIAVDENLPIDLLSLMRRFPNETSAILNEDISIEGYQKNPYISQIREALGYKKGEFPELSQENVRKVSVEGVSDEHISMTSEVQVGKERAGIADIYALNLSSKEIENLKGLIDVHSEEYNPLKDEDTEHIGNKQLDVEDLEKAGLLPQHAVKIENALVLLSPAYQIEDRVAFVGYVKVGDRLVARSYYLSQSQGIWRYLPKYSHIPFPGIPRYSKGHTEESIMLPIPLQLALSTLADEQSAPLTVPGNPFFYFEGTARSILSEDTGTYVNEVGEIPHPLEGNFFRDNRLEKVPPEEIHFAHPEKDGPDFSETVATWEQNTNQYGPITVEIYKSKDKNLQYMFCRDKKGRVWIGGVEDTQSEIQSIGLRESWINPGDLTTPAYEYVQQVGKKEYANFEDSKGDYVDMYENYIKRIPVIQEYLRQRKQ